MPLGKYELKEEIGRGGMAIVYRAIRKSDGVELAIKQIRPDKLVGNPWNQLALRFRSEAEILQRLTHHKNIVTLYDVESNYLAMEMLRGGTLEEQAPNCLGDYYLAARYCLTAANAITHAHKLGIIHRDLSLRNLMFRDLSKSSDDLVVTDFGLAVHWQDTLRLTNTGEFVGTLEFSSPEQLEDSKHVGEPTDVFSLGVVLFRLCTGVSPYPPLTFNSPDAVARNRGKAKELSKACYDLGLPPCPIELAGICSRCLVPLQDGRIRSMSEFVREIRQFLGVSP